MISQVNIEAFRMINDLGKTYDALNPAAIFMAEYMLYILLFSLLVYWFTRTEKNRMAVIQGLLAVGIAEVLGKIAGAFYSHDQPFAEIAHVHKLVQHEVDNAFPSDHSIIFFAICFSIWLVRKREGWLWMVVAVCVGISRIMVGVHYPGDVLTGALLGMGSAVFVHWVIPKLSFIKNGLARIEKWEQYIMPLKTKSEDENF